MKLPVSIVTKLATSLLPALIQSHTTKAEAAPARERRQASRDALSPHARGVPEGTGIADDIKGPLFRTVRRGTGQFSDTPLPQANAYAMVRRRAVAAGIGTAIGNHTFRATGITAYLKNGGMLENATAMANHASTRTTQLYDRRHNEISLDEVERIRL